MKKPFYLLILISSISCSTEPKSTITEWDYSPYINNKKFGDSYWLSDIKYTFSKDHQIVNNTSQQYYFQKAVFGSIQYEFDALEVRLYYTNLKYNEYPHVFNKQEFTIVKHIVSEPHTVVIYDSIFEESEYKIYEK